MPWLALTIEVESAWAEAMSDALLESGAQSVSLETPGAPRCRLEALVAVDSDVHALIADAARRAASPGLPAFATHRVEDEDWVRRTQAQFTPIAIGERLLISPTWCEPPHSRRVVVRLDPGLAFGTGTHPSTRLVLRFLERRVTGGESVLDYGCGSGILAIAAAKLGAAHVDAIDLDPDAVQAAAANAAANAAPVRVTGPDALVPALYDIVVANILAQPLIVLAPLLAARTQRGGSLALSGILAAQAPDVVAAYLPYFDAAASENDEGWALVAGTRR